MDCIDVQDNQAALYLPWKSTFIEPDETASDLRAVRMPGSHKEWAFRLIGKKLPPEAQSGKWNIYIVARARLENVGGNGAAFAAGVYDNKTRTVVAELTIKASDLADGYKSFSLSQVELNSDRDIWVAPPGRKDVQGIWIDRVYLTRPKH